MSSYQDKRVWGLANFANAKPKSEGATIISRSLGI